jgi:hypothetical protein
LEYFVAKEIVGRVGIDFAITCITGLSSSAQSIYGLINYIQSDDTHKELIYILESKDIETTIKILESFVNEMKIDTNTSNTVITCLKGVHNVIIKIENELLLIQEKIKWNKSLYVLKSVRSYDFTTNIARINNLLFILNNRKTLLFEIVAVSYALSKNKENNNRSILEESWIMPPITDKKNEKDISKEI